MVAFTQTPASDAVAPRSSSAPTTKSSTARVPTVVPLASPELLHAIPCRAEESLRHISAGFFTAGEAKETATAGDRTCGESEVSSAQFSVACVEHAYPVVLTCSCTATCARATCARATALAQPPVQEPPKMLLHSHLSGADSLLVARRVMAYGRVP